MTVLLGLGDALQADLKIRREMDRERSDRVAQRSRAARQGWVTRRRRNAGLAPVNPAQTNGDAAGDGHAGIEVRIPAHSHHESPASVENHESPASAASNLEGRQANESHRDHRMVLGFVLTAPDEPASSTTSNLHDGNSETAGDSNSRAPAASSSTTPGGGKTLIELIEELRRRPGYPWHNTQPLASLPTTPGPANIAAPPQHVQDSTTSAQSTIGLPEQQHTGNNVAPMQESTETSTARTSSYVQPMPPPPSNHSPPTLNIAQSLIQQRTTAALFPPSTPPPTVRLPPRPDVALSPPPDCPGIIVHCASPESAANNRYRNPDVYLGQPPDEPHLVPRDEVALRAKVARGVAEARAIAERAWRVRTIARAMERTRAILAARERRAREAREAREAEQAAEAREREEEDWEDSDDWEDADYEKDGDDGKDNNPVSPEI
ncbi:MAG: hypothetical protein LQ350_001860 [Teloschistes chrysophthalmus]|nr:MAG: hypothetical protein LQ350_001860 [Niorma chrysophthalma]